MNISEVTQRADMKKQKPIKSKATTLQERLVTKDSFQLINARNFGTAHSRNERHHEQKMKSLRDQQNKRLAKLADEMHEVRAHHKMLKEVDETARDPRSIAVETEVDHDIGDHNGDVHAKRDDAAAVGIKPHQTQNPALGFKGKEVKIKKQTLNALNTSGAAKEERPKSVNHIAYNRIRNSPRIPRQKSGNGFQSRSDAMASNGSFLSGLLDIRVKRDASLLKHYNYNLTNKGNSLDAQEKRRGNAAHKELINEEPEILSEHHYRENHQLNRTRGGKPNTQATGQTVVVRQHAEMLTKHGEEASNHGRGVHVTTSSRHAAANDASPQKVAACLHEKRNVRFQEHGQATGKSGTEVGLRPSDDDGLEESALEPTEQNWAQTLRKCRYLRKPKGYETPEIPIEAVFQRDVTIT